MKKRKLFLGMALLSVALCSCSPECVDCGCDDCDDSGNGNFALIRDWSNLWQNTQQPEELDVYLYHQTLAPWHRTTYTDTSYYIVPSGSYQVVAVNKSNAVLFQGMDNYYTAEVCLPTRTIDSVLTVTEAPLNLIDQTSVRVTTEGTTACIVAPAPFIKVVNFRIHIIRQGDVKEITGCKGRLSGVLTAAKICVEQNSWFSACLDFPTQKASENDFAKTVTLLGMNPGISHRLNLILTDIDGTSKRVEVDVTGQLDFSKVSVLNCTIEITLTGTEAKVDIIDWQPGVEEDIVLQ